MILVDTSVWVGHLKKSHLHFEELLNSGQVACHPFVIGELACGQLKPREEILLLLSALPTVQKAEDEEVLHFIETRKLMNSGIGLVDVHLLVSSELSDVLLWTQDKKLKAIAEKIGVAYLIH